MESHEEKIQIQIDTSAWVHLLSHCTETIKSYRGPRDGRLWVFVECQHPPEENSPRLGPVFPETGEAITTIEQNNVDLWGGKMTHDSEHSQTQKLRSLAYLTFLPFSETFVLLRIPAFSKFCTWKYERSQHFNSLKIIVN